MTKEAMEHCAGCQSVEHCARHARCLVDTGGCWECAGIGAELANLKATVLVLSPRDQQALMEALENPPEPNEALKRAFAQKGSEE